MTYRIFLFVCCAVIVGCGTEPSPESASPGTASRAPSAGLVPQSAIDSCAGMTPEAAAAFVDAKGRPLKDFSEQIGKSSQRQCIFNTETVPYAGISFVLSPEKSVDEAKAEMESERENLRLASGAIGRVTGSESKDPPVQEVEGVGEEAFRGEVNNALVFRVANVIVQVNSPNPVDRQKRVAEAIIRGLPH